MTPATTGAPSRPDWPAEPYKGLVYYGPEDRLLFSGRDDDVEYCVDFILSAETRILLLHGQTGCGKSSFLRAGLIPILQSPSFGYFFARNDAGSPIFIRSGSDPIGRIAEHVFSLASKPVSAHSLTGPVICDLRAALLGCEDIGAFVEECRKPARLLQSLHIISETLPHTLVIVLDQAEEVITLNEGKHNPYRWQFFRFIKEFGTTNFPLKFIVALRKDYSGEFIGRTLMGSSLELTAEARATPDADAAAPDRIVKSDLKIFLLSELDRDAVLRAIVLPTSDEPVEGRVSAFERYRFTYASDVASQIVSDLFQATSAVAVLPVMQIVCRDLFNKVKNRTENRVIDADMYRDGGGISGPVDRHIGQSLKDGFGELAAPGDTAAEEVRWREILFRLVRRESDGTVHTNIVSRAQLATWAAELGVVADLGKVLDHLIEPDVLLLRSVTIATADDRNEGRMFSLGHDVIGAVLQEWKTRQVDMEQRASEAAAERKRIADERAVALQKITEEREALNRRIRNFGVAGITVVALGALMLGVTIWAVAKGHAAEKHVFLYNAAVHDARSAPMEAIRAAADASKAERQARIPFFKAEKQADFLLARIALGLPSSTIFENEPTAEDRNALPVVIPLPKSHAFANVDQTNVEIAGSGDARWSRKFELGVMPDRSAQLGTRTKMTEPSKDATLLMRTSGNLIFPDLASNTQQIFLLLADGSRPAVFSARDFLTRSNIPTPPVPPAPAKNNMELYLADFNGPRITLMNGLVVVWSEDIKSSELRVTSFAYDETKRGTAFPFEIRFSDAFSLDWSRNGKPLFPFLLVSGRLLLPTRNATGSGPIRMYDLAIKDAPPIQLVTLGRLMECGGQASCDWQLFYPIGGDDNFLFAGSLKPSERQGDVSSNQNFRPDLDRFQRIVIFDATSDRAIPIDLKQLRAIRTDCDLRLTARDDSPPSAGDASKMAAVDGGDGLVVLAAKDELLLGFDVNSSVDLVRYSFVDSAPSTRCDRTLFKQMATDAWTTSADGQSILAGGKRGGAEWPMNTKNDGSPDDLVKNNLALMTACRRGLATHKVAASQSTVAAVVGLSQGNPCDNFPDATVSTIRSSAGTRTSPP